MRLDKYSNPIFSEQDLFDVLYKGQSIPSEIFVENSKDIDSLKKVSDLSFWEPIKEHGISIEEYDSAMSNNWYMPEEYKTFDIESWVLNQCNNDTEITRVQSELEAYKARNMLDLLRWLKYFVDNCSKNNIVWGIGRGSSVASYVLYIIGVHSVDSIKYNLDWQEFLR